MKSTAGKFLVANPNMKTSLFSKSVIYVIDHDLDGASGFIINKSSSHTVSDVAMSCGYHFTEFSQNVFVGGPVNRHAAFLLHSDEWYSETTSQVGKRLAITSDTTMFEKLCMGNEPARWKLCIGMCGWAPEQLDWELEGTNRPYPSWIVCEAHPDLIYSTDDNDKIWEQCLEIASQQWVDEFF